MEYIAPAVASGIASEQEALAAYNAGMRNYLVANPDGGTPETWKEFNDSWNSYDTQIRNAEGYRPLAEQPGYRNTTIRDPGFQDKGAPTEQDYLDADNEERLRSAQNVSSNAATAASQLGNASSSAVLAGLGLTSLALGMILAPSNAAPTSKTDSQSIGDPSVPPIDKTTLSSPNNTLQNTLKVVLSSLVKDDYFQNVRKRRKFLDGQ